MTKRLLAAAVALGVSLAGGATAAVPGVPSLYVVYAQTCTFALTVDPGTPITAASAPGPTLPPGTYQLLTQMPNPSNGYLCSAPAFTLTGPGVAVSIPFPAQALDDMRLVTLQPSSTYVAEDENAPATTRRFFSTSATGSSTSLLPQPATATTPAGSQQQPDIVGSAIPPYRGLLVARVPARGAATLTRAGRTVVALAPGRYAIEVVDATRHAGFYVERGRQRPLAVSSVRFVGKRRRTVTLGAGRWRYFSTAATATPFVVSGA
jgi:hypothetical protein